MAQFDTDRSVRIEYMRKLSQLLDTAGLRQKLTVKSADGSYPIAVALGHERVADVFDRIQSDIGAINLFVIDSNERIHLVSLHGIGHGVGAASELAQDVHHNVTMDFLVMCMRLEGQAHIRVTFDDLAVEATRELDDTEILLPA